MAKAIEDPVKGRRGAAASVVSTTVRAWSEGAWSVRPDPITVEEPLEIRIEHRGANRVLAVTMRTPGDDEALVAGFLLSEGLVDDAADLVEVRPCAGEGPDGEPTYNVVQALLRASLEVDPGRFMRSVYTNASCGVCGRNSIDAIEVASAPLPPGRPHVLAETLHELPGRLRAAQRLFARTGGIHATGLFTPGGDLVDVAEDVGRHNATDKVVGRALVGGRLPLSDHVLVVSGRASFEIVQKAARAGVPFVAAIGAPSSLAVATAERLGMTLVGFLDEERFNAYANVGRIRGLTCTPARSVAE